MDAEEYAIGLKAGLICRLNEAEKVEKDLVLKIELLDELIKLARAEKRNVARNGNNEG